MGKIFAFTSSAPSNYPDILNKDSLKCPTCNTDNDYLHFKEPILINGYDSYSAKICGWEGRGSVIVIPFYCECCSPDDFSKMCLCLGFHKGTVALWFFVANQTDIIPTSNSFSER